ncbi:MAG: helicase C-terminal domain-containing protein, partial [Clostridiales bacterium]|nr:helicase C-terminal domain-containing protein [Clostridiales bacterium]
EDLASDRFMIKQSEPLRKKAKDFQKALDVILLEMQIEQELYIGSIPTSLMQAYEGIVEKAMIALNQFCKGVEMIPWVDAHDQSFWVVPRNIDEMLNQHLYSKRLPVIFTSATLSNKGNFDYFNRMIGVKNPSKSMIGSPFNLEEQVVISIPELSNKEDNLFEDKICLLIKLLNENGGRALVLTNSLSEVRKIRKALEQQTFEFEVMYEDQGDRGYLARRFRDEETTVLIGANYWEGIDIPGDALNLVVIWELPFPSLDPLVEAQRNDAKEQGLDPLVAVDYPEMGLKLKQGCGRLIRREEDHGKIVILDQVRATAWENVVLGALPIQI